MVDRLRQDGADRIADLDAGPREKNGGGGLGKAGGDGDALLGGLSLAEDDLRVAGADGAMRVQASEAQVIVRKPLQCGKGVIDAGRAGLHVAQKAFEVGVVHMFLLWLLVVR